MKRRRVLIVGWLVLALSVATGITAGSTAVAAGDPVVMVAGDIACAPGSNRGAKCETTSRLRCWGRPRMSSRLATTSTTAASTPRT